MVMPRPSGKAQKIAEQTIPGLDRNKHLAVQKHHKTFPNDEVELKVVKINQNLGRSM